MPTPIDATQSQHCGQMKRAPPCSSVSSGMRGGRRAEDRSLPLSVLRFLLWQSDGNRATACFTGGEAGGRDAGTVPALEKKRRWRAERKNKKERLGEWQWDHRGPQSLLLFHASLCVSRVTGKAQWSTNFTPSWARGPRIESMRQTETDSVLTLCLQATWGQ